ncbi:right-handed parallel beta-helix repeat-containing protein [Telmatobacter sp. DSM 110680]|uniref:Right-handed parallel beta-helix repeat-containing protein n=1 Tax=Telmatobacter sp. DSM 110680 TaxID=3036704 RepID=A0AAU7DD97_9BACT
MRLAAICISFSLIVLFIAEPSARSQANVIENQTTVLYVDAQKGSDSNVGSTSSPLKSIQAAVNKANVNNQNQVGTKIIVNAGVYRETVGINPISNQTTVPLTIQAAVTGTAIISGANVLSNWATDSTYSSAYTTSWYPTMGTCPLPSGWPTGFSSIAMHTEMIFVNSVPLTQVLSYSQMRAGTFYINEGSGSLHLWPANGTNMQTALVEAATRQKTVSIVGRTNIVLRGLTLTQSASCINSSGATVTSGSNVLIDSVQANWNNWGGLGIFSSNNVTVQNSVANYNGGIGFMGSKSQNILFSFNESDYNNWRGAQSAYYDWGMGGAKFFQMRSMTVQDHFSYNNQAQGLWFDTDNKNITINRPTLAGNTTAALQIERNEGPVTVENGHLCSSGSGVNLLTSEQVRIQNNVFYNNGATNKYQAQIYLAGQAGGIVITDWQTSQSYDLFTKGLVLTGNTFVDGATGQNVFGTYLSGSDWSDFASTLNASDNVWYDPFIANSFKVVNGHLVNLSGWQNSVGTDYTSTWAAPATSPVAACALPAVKYADFGVVMNANTYTMSAGSALATAKVTSFGFGTVNLSVSGLPAGVSATINNGSLISGTSTITFSASSSASNQTVPVTVWAVSGSRVHTATFNLHVVPL